MTMRRDRSAHLTEDSHINARLQPRRLSISPAAVGCKPMFGGDRSDAGPQPATGVPESKHLNRVLRDPVVHEVPNSRQGNASYTGQDGSPCWRSHFGLHRKQTKDPVEFFQHGIRHGRSVLTPPSRGLLNLRASLVRNLDSKRAVHADRRSCSRSRSHETT